MSNLDRPPFLSYDESSSFNISSSVLLASNTNYLLRLIRHCVCSHLKLMSTEFATQDEYMSYATQLLDGMQNLPSIQSICGVIRMGKEIANSKPVNITKEFDDLTGDVMYNGVTITKDNWSTSIPRTVHQFRSLLLPLFECQNLLEDVLNPNNKMVLAGPDTTVTVVDEEGTVVKVIHVVSDIIPILHGENTQSVVNNLFSLEQGIYLYLSSGAGRGEEIKRVHSFQSAFQLLFNHLRFQMKSTKAVNHGVDRNDWVDHFVSPSLSRLIIVLNLCVYEAIRSGSFPELKVPAQEEAKAAARDMFRLIFGISSTNTKEYREFCILIVNYIAPSSLARTSTIPEFASQFHHSRQVHDSTYSSTLFRRSSDGQIRRGPLLLAQQYHQALGEATWNSDRVADIDEDTIPSEMYHKALRRGLRQPSVLCNYHQMKACQLLDNYSNHTHAFVFRPPGTGKSFLWNGILLARFLRGSKRRKFIVLSPHSALLAQHVLQSKDFFTGTSLKVVSLTAVNLDNANTIGDFDLCYISIHAFALMSTTMDDLLKSWEIGTIYIDECHLLFCELFRIGNSWNALQDIASFGTKLVSLSATINQTAMKMIAHYMGISSNYEVIGDASSYQLPNVSIQVREVQDSDLIPLVVQELCHRFQGYTSNFSIHVMTSTKNQAVTISTKLKSNGLKSEWLTSDDSNVSRISKMSDWSAAKLQVLVSTMNCGFDCNSCREVFIVGKVRSAADAIQSIGRIRPKQQNKSPVTFWMTEKSYQQWDDTSKRWLQWDEWAKSEWDEWIETLEINHLFDCFDEENEKRVARNNLRFLFSPYTPRSIFSGTDCYRKRLYKAVGVQSNAACKMCSVCKKQSPMSQSVNEANERKNKREQEILRVNNIIKTLKTHCFACDDKTCCGLNCVMVPTTSKTNPQPSVRQQHWCKLCFGKTDRREYFHTSNDSRASATLPLCKVATITNHSKMCKHCCMLLDESIEERGKKDDHNKGHGNCVYKLRIRRILLHKTLRTTDRGQASKQLLQRVSNNQKLWYETMATNVRLIESSKVQI